MDTFACVEVYVTSRGGKQGAEELRGEPILRLRKCPGIAVVTSSSDTDIILPPSLALGVEQSDRNLAVSSGGSKQQS